MGTATDPVDAARERLAQLEADRGSWEVEHDAATGDLADLAADRGRRLVDGDVTAEELAAEEARHRSRIASADAAMDELARRIAEARRQVIAAYVARLEERAVPLQKALDAHRSKVDRLLDQLEELDGIPYVVMPAAQQAARVVGAPVAADSSHGVTLKASVTTQLRIPLDDVRRHIEQLRRWTTDPLTAEEYATALANAERALDAEPARTATTVGASTR